VRRLFLLAAVLSVCGCAMNMTYEEPILRSCGYLTGDQLQDVCHASLYRVPPDERTEDMVDEIRQLLEIEGQ